MFQLFTLTKEKAQSAVNAQEDALRFAEEDVEGASMSVEAARSAILHGEGSESSLRRAKVKFRNAQQAVDEVRSRLALAKAQLNEIVEIEALRESAARRKEVEEIGDERLLLAAEIEADAVAFVEKYKRLQELSLKQFNTAPVKPYSLEDMKLSPGVINGAVRTALWKAGIEGVMQSPWGRDSLPTLFDTVRDGTTMLMKSKDQKVMPAAEQEPA